MDDAKKEKTRRESTPVKVWVTPAEKAAIAEKATAHSMSASRYLRALGLALPIQSTIDHRAVLDLLKINADLGRSCPIRWMRPSRCSRRVGFHGIS